MKATIEERSVKGFLIFFGICLLIVWLIDLKIRVVKLEKQQQEQHATR